MLYQISKLRQRRFLFYLMGMMFVVGIGGCGNTDYTWGWYVITPWHPIGLTNIQFLLSGLGYTIMLSLSAIVLSISMGLIVTLPALMNNTLARLINRVYVEIFRSIPVLVISISSGVHQPLMAVIPPVRQIPTARQRIWVPCTMIRPSSRPMRLQV